MPSKVRRDVAEQRDRARWNRVWILFMGFVLPMLVIAVCFYQIVFHFREKSYRDMAHVALQKQDSQMEEFFLQAAVTAQTASINPIFINAVNRRGFDPGYDAGLAEKQILSEVNAIAQSNLHIHSVYFVSGLDNTVYSSMGGEYNRDYFYDLSWMEQYNKKQSNIQILQAPRRVLNPFGEEYQYISLATKLPYLSYNENGVLLLNVDVGRLRDYMIAPKEMDVMHTYMLDRQGGVILQSQSNIPLEELEGQPFFEEMLASEAFSARISIEGESYQMISIDMENNPWKLMALVPVSAVAQGMFPVKSAIAWIMLAYTLLAAALSWLLERKWHSPVARALRQVEQALPGEIPVEPQPDELDYMSGAFDGLAAAYGKSRAVIHHFRPMILDDLLKNILLASRLEEGRKREYREMLARIGEPFPESNYCVASIKLDGFTQMKVNLHRDDYRATRQKVQEACGRLTSGHFQSIWLWTDTTMIAGVLSINKTIAPKMLSASLTALAHQLRDSCLELSEGLALVGFGGVVEDIMQLGDSFRQAEELVQYKAYHRVDYPHCYEQLVKTNIVLEYDKQKLFVSLLKLGKEMEACEILANYFSIVHSNPQSDLDDIRDVAKQVVNLIFEALTSVGLEPEEVVGHRSVLYTQIQDLPTVHGIADAILGMTKGAGQKVCEKLDAKGEQRMAELLEWIEQNYNADISLQDIARQLGLSATYASKRFKAFTGKDIVTYINGIRLEEAKKLLVNTKMSVTEIGAYVGFNHAQSFIRAFKKYTGMTPGNYRSLEKEHNQVEEEA